ncbi:MAG: hypothetical protein ABW034_20090 [Steroidobacteraceae bacterium]
MSATLLPWLDDSALSRLANFGVSDRSMWDKRYEPNCPSEFYRGYATLLMRIGDQFHANANLTVLGQLVDAFGTDIRALPAGELRKGASLALANVAGYAEEGTVQQISATLNVEVVCVARCFVHNQAKGI